jgi:hypothetical protein
LTYRKSFERILLEKLQEDLLPEFTDEKSKEILTETEDLFKWIQ